MKILNYKNSTYIAILAILSGVAANMQGSFTPGPSVPYGNFYHGYSGDSTGYQECQICYEDLNPNLFYRLSCGHSYCTACIERMVDVAIQSRSGDNLRCPTPACSRPFDQETLAGMGFITDKIAQVREIIAQREADIQASRNQGFFDRFKGHDLRTMVKIYMSTKPCPNCKASIEKNSGCKHMTCRACKHEFCWICMGNWRGHSEARCGTKVLEKSAKVGLGLGLLVAGIKSYKKLPSARETFKKIKTTTISTKDNLVNRLNHTWSNIKTTVKKNKKNLAQVAIAGGTFIALEKYGVNYSQEVLDCLYKILGPYKYDAIFNEPNYPSLEPIGLNYRNGRLINAGISIAASFAARPRLNQIFKDAEIKIN